jgi:iron complex outermembrane recepter protein
LFIVFHTVSTSVAIRNVRSNAAPEKNPINFKHLEVLRKYAQFLIVFSAFRLRHIPSRERWNAAAQLQSQILVTTLWRVPMYVKQKRIAFAVLQAVAGMAIAVGANAQTNQPQRVEKVEVTGSNIKRIDAESANPVQVITRQEIERTGASTINDVLQRITGAGFALDDRITNGFAPGGGSLNLRGLGFNSTLILVNGRRLPTYPFAQQVGTPQGFNDINNIPLAAVERVEVLKDGASAIYGADAVAGVVNIILRRDYTGMEMTAGIGASERGDGESFNASFAGGWGDIAKDRFNILVTGNISGRDPIASRDRPWSGTEDLRPRGGSDRRSGFGYPGTIYELLPDRSDYTGNVTYDVGGTCGPTTQRGGSSVRGGLCRYDRATLGSLQGESDKAGIYSRLNFAITPNITAFGEVLFTRNQFKSVGWPAGTTDDVGIGSYLIPAGSPANPFANESEVYTRFAGVGNRGDDGKSDTSRFLLGVKGTTAGWDWEAAANINTIKINTFATNNALTTRFMCLLNPQAAASYAAGGNPLGFGTLAQIFSANPSYAAYFQRELGKCGAAFAQYGYYNFINPSLNKPGVDEYLRHNALRQGRSNLDGYDFKASRELMQLPGGPLGFAFGGETRTEKVRDVPDEQLQTGDTLSISAAQAFGERRVSAFYGELNAPLTKSLEANIAVRYDKYTGNGKFAATSPKVGLRFQPTQQVLLRATASKAFRAPSLFETSPAQQTSFAFGLQDPVRCPTFDENNPDCVLDVRRVAQGNPNLKAEKSTSYTFGVVLEPTRDLTVALDFWQIERKDEIGSFADQLLLNLNGNNPAIVVRDPSGRITQLNQVPVQLNETKTNGVDIDVTHRASMAGGKLTTRLGFSYVGTYKFTTLDNEANLTVSEFNGTYNQPRYRGSWDFAFERGAWEFSLGGYGIHSYSGLGATANVGAMEVWNTSLTYRGVKNLSVRLGVNNVFDRGQPFNDESSGSNAGYNPSFAEPVGRFYTLGMRYTFR